MKREDPFISKQREAMRTGKMFATTDEYLRNLLAGQMQKQSLPDDGAMQRALQFRMKEKQHIQALAEENMLLRSKLKELQIPKPEKIKFHEVVWFDALETNSKSNFNGTPDSSSDGRTRDVSVPLPPSTDSKRETDRKLESSEVPATDLPDPSGHSKEHTAA